MGKAPNPANMDTCDKKCKCTFGPYANQAYQCKTPCNDGCNFSCQNGCECGDSSGCWLIEVVRSSGAEGENPPEDVENLYQNVPVGWDLGLRTRSTSLPSSGFNHFPVEQECTEEDVAEDTCGAGLPSTTFYSQFNGDTGICVSEDAPISSDDQPGGTLRVEVNGFGPDITELQSASARGVDYCNIDSVSITDQGQTFPPNESNPSQTCRNPFTLWGRILRINGRYQDFYGDWYPCGAEDCQTTGSWYQAGVQFVELDFARIKFFYTASDCGYDTRGGFLMEYRVERAFNFLDTQDGWANLNIYQGEILTNDQAEPSTRSVGTYFGLRRQAAKAEIYIAPSGSASPTSYDDIPQGWQLIDSAINTDPNIDTNCF